MAARDSAPASAPGRESAPRPAPGWAARIAALPCGRRTKYLVLAFWILVIAVTGSLSAKLMGAEKNDASAYPAPVILTEIGLCVALGVLLDTIIVRSVLITALNLDIGDRIWWPSRLAGPSGHHTGAPATPVTTARR